MSFDLFFCIFYWWLLIGIATWAFLVMFVSDKFGVPLTVEELDLTVPFIILGVLSPIIVAFCILRNWWQYRRVKKQIDEIFDKVIVRTGD